MKKYKIVFMSPFSKKFWRIFLTAVIFTGGLLFNNVALAQSDENNLTVEVWESSSSSWIPFNSQALFSEVDFLPRQDSARRVKVTNETEEEQKIGVKFIDTGGVQCDGSCLSDKLDISINKNNNLLRNGILTSFYKDGETYLSNISAEQSIEYELSVKFISGAGNSYQKSAVKFDIEIGFFGEESIGEEVSSGGSEGIIMAGARISNENVSDIGGNQATITWMTNYKSTSRVIYDTTSKVFDLNIPPNYGYAFSSAEEDNTDPISDNGVINHSVILSNLTAGTTYYYRGVSHASPPSITEERSFITLEPSNDSDGHKKSQHHKKSKKPASNILASSLKLSNGESEKIDEETSAADSSPVFSELEGVEGTEKENGEIAGEQKNDCKGQSWWIWTLALFVYSILFNFNNFYGEQKRERIRWFWEVFYTIATLSLWRLLDQCHINIWFPYLVIIVGLLSYGYYLRGVKKFRDNKIK